MVKTFAIAVGVLGAAATTTCTAQADPMSFPDLSGYVAVNPEDYVVLSENPGRPYPLAATYFLTPDGVLCDFVASQAQCLGNDLPGVPPASPSSNGSARVNWIGTASGLKSSAAADVPTRDAVRTLPPLHSITVDGVVCGVDDSGTTACKDSQGRGFILSPRGSGWLPAPRNAGG